ncbi:MAG: hypothetical protein GY739_18600 [Mesoflavibacter sp.]|nr:hypothetical protein [Mesoflavibacter sp.]
MDSNAGILLASGLVSLAVHSFNCFGKKRVLKLYKTKLSSLIISKGCGKTQLKKSLSALSSDLHIVDVGAIIQSNDDLEYLKQAKEYVDGLLKQFPKKKFLLLLSTKEESEYLGVDKVNSFAVCPSVNLFNQILGDVKPELLEYKKTMEKERLELIKNTDSDQLNIFDSFEHLYNVIKRVYKLQSSF